MSEQSLDDKIIRQIEYYFGDINLSKDKFMQEEIQKDSGWVSLETLIKFNRLKSLSTDFKVIIDALKKSENNLLEIDVESNKIRRTKALPENLGEFETNLKQNTVYVKGFPNTLSLDELIAFFEAYGKVLQVYMRRFPTTKQFKGSVFVTFETNEQMKAFLALEKPKYQDQELILESQEDYIKRKGPQLESIKEAKKKKEEQKELKIKQKQEAEEAYLKEQQVLGAVLHLKGFNEEGTRENLKELFDSFAKVKFVDYSKGLPEAYVRFAEENNAKLALEKALEKNNGELTLKGAKLEARILEGEEETEYWRNIIRKFAEGKSNKKNNNRNKKRNNRKKPDYNKNKNGKRALNEDEDDDDEDDENVNGNENKNGNEEKLEKIAENQKESAEDAANKKIKVA